MHRRALASDLVVGDQVQYSLQVMEAMQGMAGIDTMCDASLTTHKSWSLKCKQNSSRSPSSQLSVISSKGVSLSSNLRFKRWKRRPSRSSTLKNSEPPSRRRRINFILCRTSLRNRFLSSRDFAKRIWNYQLRLSNLMIQSKPSRIKGTSSRVLSKAKKGSKLWGTPSTISPACSCLNQAQSWPRSSATRCKPSSETLPSCTPCATGWLRVSGLAITSIGCSISTSSWATQPRANWMNCGNSSQ